MILYSSALEHYLKYHPGALDDTVQHFGPNYEAVLNFWVYIDTLTEDQIRSIMITDSRSYSLEDYCENIVLDQYGVWRSARYFRALETADYEFSSFLGYATLELVAMHDLLNAGHNLILIPRFGVL